jgi:hypothetical protein
VLYRGGRVGIKKFSLHSARDQDRAEEIRNKIGQSGHNEIAQRRRVGYNSHGLAKALPGTIRKLLERLGFTVQLGGIVIIKINVPRQEVFGLDAREGEELASLKLGESALPVAVKGERFQSSTRQITVGSSEGARQVVRDAKRELHQLSITERATLVKRDGDGA